MPTKKYTQYISLLFAGFGVIVGLSLVILVRAVAPGTVSNPTFSPQDDDVESGVQRDLLSCYWTGWGCSLSCNPDYFVAGFQTPTWYNDLCYDNGGDMDIPQQQLLCCKYQ